MSRSLQFRLSLWLSLAILAVAVATGVFSFVSAFQEAIELQDDQLRQMAALIHRQRLQVTHFEGAPNVADPDPETRVVVQLLRAPVAASSKTAGELPGLPVNLPDGIQTVTVQQVPWRVFVKTLASGARIAVGQQVAVRDEIARNSALQTVLSFLILIPILLLLVGYLIKKMFSPLTRMASELGQRSENDLREIAAAGVPAEIQPFVAAINRLLSLVARSVAMQRRFVADAAHELRSPLTALSLQAERLGTAALPEPAREELRALDRALQRTRGLVEQLLTLARIQETSPARAEGLSIQKVFRQILEGLLPLAEAKNIDIGVTGAEDPTIMAPAADLEILIKNLVENAIRYTPDGGRIDLSVRTGSEGIIVQIEDTGPGIPAAERQRVFDPFYRLLGNDTMGSGLGLSIVRTIADRLGATVRLDDADAQHRKGLRVTVTFP